VNTNGAMGLANVVKSNLGAFMPSITNTTIETSPFRTERYIEDASGRCGTDQDD
jgi:hypothetical protein